jgi:hypothetical protein
MENWETFWRFTVTSLAVWRLSRLLIEEKGSGRGGKDGEQAAGVPAREPGGIRFRAGRVVDLACWISVWISSQTAIWVTCGLAGVFLSWLAACGVSRLFLRGAETGEETSRDLRGDQMRHCGDEMRTHNG